MWGVCASRTKDFLVFITPSLLSLGEAAEHLASNLPTNKGVVIVGGPGTGKTALLLKLVEMSCFGRGEPIYQGIKDHLISE